jgi:hypothetical protein
MGLLTMMMINSLAVINRTDRRYRQGAAEPSSEILERIVS